MKAQNDLFDLNALTEENNRERIGELKVTAEDLDGIFSMSVNWTFEGLCTLIKNNVIELSPPFQRKNVWGDERRSALIESIYLGLPIPPIILAEFPNGGQERRYMVIDGKQRLQTMIGFFDPETYPFWKETKGVLSKKLEIAENLCALSYEALDSRSKRILNNAVVPTWTMHNIKQKNMKVLNHIFYRVNAGAVPLNLQELRQVLYHGGFSTYLAEITDTLQPFQEVMGYNEPDERMNDIEYLVRIIGNKFLQDKYKSSLADFLDLTMSYLNKNWRKLEREVRNYYDNINKGITHLENIWGHKRSIGKVSEEKFNKAFCEVQLFYFAELNELLVNDNNIINYKNNLVIAFSNRSFSDLFTRGTNSNYHKRFAEFKKIIDNSFKIN
ncbi:MAG: DUF262 domain-containing protein [Cytophagia bacterium]|nr:MAG: DUF262 domain-containing protein [Cytophagia bacterium]